MISFANSKGGSGKSTAALVLGCELAEKTDVVVIDADPRRPLVAWSKLAPPPGRLKVISSQGEQTIQDEIEQAAARVPFVLVDLEGAASRLASFAMSESDLVIIPAQEQHQDAQAAVETLQEIGRVGRSQRRKIPSVVLFTRTKVVAKSRTQRHVGSQLKASEQIRTLAVELVERDAYSALYSTGGSLRDLDPRQVNGIDKAIENATAYANHVIAILKEQRNG